MRRISLLVLFFFCFSLSNPPRSRAALPLALLAPAAVGTAAFAVAGTYFAFKSDHSGSSFGTDGRNLTVPLLAYKPFLVGGAEKLLGRSVVAVLDAKKAFDDNVLQGYSALQGLIDDYFEENGDPAVVPDPKVIGPEGTCGATSTRTVGQCTASAYPTVNISDRCGSGCSPSSVGSSCVGPSGYTTITSIDHLGRYYFTTCTLVPTTDPENWPAPPPVPGELPPAHVPGLSDQFANAAPIRPDVAQALEDLLKDHPEYWPIANAPSIPVSPDNDISDYPPAQPITPGEVSNWAQGQSAGAQQNYIDTLQALVDANPLDTGLAAELAKAQAEQIQQEAEEIEETQDTFDSISDNPFSEAYNPGTFDIPVRFTSFLNNVKSSGLFSFSSGFFNSLPAGGSPVYTIDAGQYGTHTVDLSETLGTGLAVLKTVLLLLFGFLSIRVVILKR